METISNPSLSKLYRKNPNINVVGWYKMSFVVYFELVLVWKEISYENYQNWPFPFLFDTLSPSQRSARLGEVLLLEVGRFA